MDTLVIRIPHPQRLVSFTRTMLFAKTARIEETNGGNCQERQKKRGKKHERQHIKHQRAKLEETMRKRHCHSSSFSVLLWAEGAHAV
jgi:hypothetical protein